eukprot:gene937-803_t
MYYYQHRRRYGPKSTSRLMLKGHYNSIDDIPATWDPDEHLKRGSPHLALQQYVNQFSEYAKLNNEKGKEKVLQYFKRVGDRMNCDCAMHMKCFHGSFVDNTRPLVFKVLEYGNNEPLLAVLLFHENAHLFVHNVTHLEEYLNDENNSATIAVTPLMRAFEYSRPRAINMLAGDGNKANRSVKVPGILVAMAKVEYRLYLDEKRSKQALQYLQDALPSDASTNIDAYIQKPYRWFESSPARDILENQINEYGKWLMLGEEGYGPEPLYLDNKRCCLQSLKGFFNKWLK